MRRLDLSILMGIVISILVGSFSGFGAECGEIRENVVRLHILANSDSREDQELKYAVRDALLACSEEIFGGGGDKSGAEAMIAEKLSEMENTAETEINSRGYAYPVHAELVNMYFETREYDDFIAPAGRYDAVRITIGEGNGKNWWCVMFPPMCVPAAMEKPGPEVEEQIRALGETPGYKPKFAVVELIEGIKNKLEKREDEAVEITEEPQEDQEGFLRRQTS